MHTVSFIALMSVALCGTELPAPIAVGQTAPSFTLRDYLGAERSSDEWSSKTAVVIVFVGTECPLARLYGSRLAGLAARYEPQGVAFVGIDANQQDSLADIAHYAKEHKIEFPILKDAGNAVADAFGARRTPEVFLLDAKRVVRYWGQIDDQYGVGYARSAPTKPLLASALDALLAGKPIDEPASEPVGCFIGRASRTPAKGDITYSKHIAALLHQHCVRCHRAGEVAPFALDFYSEATAWAPTIREVVAAGRMPPWHANPQYGHFWNDARLPERDKELLSQWIDNGCPEGSAADLPKLPAFVDGWQIPKPDIVYQMPRSFSVPARGVVEYQYFTIDPKFTEDKWIKAAEARPGNRAVTHHLIAFFHPPGKEAFEPIEPLYNSLVGFAPGLPPAIYPAGTYRRVPAGSKIILQAHYTPNGAPQTDQSEVGLVFADPSEVKQEITVAAALSWQFMIPPGAKNHPVEASHRFTQDVLLHALTPHMHLRGKSFRFVAHLPDGRDEILLDVPRYDFNWQNSYALAKPKPLPEGTEIRCTATYDNSEENLANPNAKMPVMWGDQTWQEMMVGTLAVSLQQQDLSVGMPTIKPLDAGEYEVTFSYRPREPVKGVYLAGTFNDWMPTGLKMDGPDADGRYSAKVTLKPGNVEYKFVEDGERWRFDPGNPNQVGYYHNSLLRVGDSAKP